MRTLILAMFIAATTATCTNLYAVSNTFAPLAPKTITIPNLDKDANLTILEKRVAFSRLLNLKINFLPVNALPAMTYSELNTASGDFKEKLFSAVTDAERLALLPNQASSIKMYEFKENASISSPVAGASFAQNAGRYNVVMDYMKYRIEPLRDLNDTFYGYAKVGVGMRIIANLTTLEANVNLGSLLAIGASAGANKLSGDISVEVIGIDSPDIVNLIPLTSTIDQTSIQSALQALASIKTKLNDDHVTITPHIVAFQASEDINQTCSQPTEAPKKCSSWFWRK